MCGDKRVLQQLLCAWAIVRAFAHALPEEVLEGRSHVWALHIGNAGMQIVVCSSDHGVVRGFCACTA